MTGKQGWLAKEVARARKRRETLPEHARPTLVKQGHQVVPVDATYEERRDAVTDTNPLAAIEELVTTIRFRSGIEVPFADIPHGLRAALTEARQAVGALVAERDAYRKAKQENDERFMLERDEARAERDAAREALARVEALQVRWSLLDPLNPGEWKMARRLTSQLRATLTERLSVSSDGLSDEEAGQ